jgi:hypothetical protein
MSGPNEGAPDTAAGVAGQAPGDRTESTAIVGQPDAERKEVATLAARLALRKFSLHELACGGYLIARWDRTVHCSDLQAVAAFLRRIGGAE